MRERTLVGLFVLIAGAIAANGVETNKLTWNSPRVLEVKKKFDALQASFAGPSTIDNFGERTSKTCDFLNHSLSPQEMSDLAATCGMLPIDEIHWSDFESCLIREMVRVFLETGNRNSLVTLFSLRFPSYYPYESMDAFLVTHDQKIKYPILILGEAYWKCQVPDVRSRIAQMIRSDFKGSGIRADTDDDFVKDAMQWYDREKDNLIFNKGGRPWYFIQRPPPLPHETYKNPLFVRKPSAAGGQGNTAMKVEQVVAPSTAPVKSLGAATNSIGLKMNLIPAGEFIMGSPEIETNHQENEFPQHPVRITHPFWLGVYEVTLAQYTKIMGVNPSSFVSKNGFARYPADEGISWYDAVEFCNRLSRKEGLPEYYRLSPEKPGGTWRTVELLGGPGYRLPTEAEWECACRAGTTTPFSYGTVPKIRHPEGSSYKPKAIGSNPPNAFGLYDMLADAAEYCNDGYDTDYYENSPITDPPGSSERREIATRGGDGARSAARIGEFPWARSILDLGFRVARTGSSGTVTNISWHQ